MKPWPLTLYDRCKEFGALPVAGGMLDQPEQVMTLMATCVNVRRLHAVPYERYGEMDRDTFMYIDWLRAEANRGD